MDIVDRLWADASEVLFISKEEFVRDLQEWNITPLVVDGVLAFAGLRKGAAFHCVSFHTGHKITRKMLCDFIGPIIAEHGYATTKTPKEDERQQRFNIAFGFQFVGEDEYDVHYRIERLRGSPLH